jgi:hypothetical protein
MASIDNSYVSVEDHTALRVHNGNVSRSNGGINATSAICRLACVYVNNTAAKDERG